MAVTAGSSTRFTHAASRSRPGQRLDPLELVLLVVLAALSLWVIALDLWLASKHGLVWTGIDGEFPVDQMQYLAWVQDASRHLLVSDLFVLRPTAHDYLQPMVAISGGLTAAGMAPWLALLVWKPVAILAIFFAVRAYCRSVLQTRPERLAAIALALFAAFSGTYGDEWIPFLSWGYPFGLVAVASMVGALVAYGRARRRDAPGWWAPALGLLASWLHPWQGELLILVIAGAELVLHATSPGRRERRSLWFPGVTIGATALPLVYYAILERGDPIWRVAETITRHHPWSFWAAVLPLVPLLVLAAPAYLKTPESFVGLSARLWPLASLVVWFVTKAGLGATPLHAWTGITIPLGVLVVEGSQVLGLGRFPAYRWIGLLVVAGLTVPGSYLLVQPGQAYLAPATGNQNLVTHSEQRALRFLADDTEPGGVLSAYRLGDAVPAETGRHTYSGDFRWSEPGYETREKLAWELLHGTLTGAAARAFVLGSGARFVLADCGARVELTHTLAPLKLTVHRFGCAAVYELDPAISAAPS